MRQVAGLIPCVLWCDVQEKKRKQEEAQKKKEADVEKEREMAARWVHDPNGDPVGRYLCYARMMTNSSWLYPCFASRAKANAERAEAERRARQEQARREAEEEERRLREAMEEKARQAAAKKALEERCVS